MATKKSGGSTAAKKRPPAKRKPLQHRLVDQAKRPAGLLLIGLVTMFIAAGVFMVLYSRAATRPVGKLSPANGAYWGIYTSSGIANRESLTGRKFAVQQRYYAWTDTFPGASENDDITAGRIPLVTWEPWQNHTAISSATLSDIANGKFDANIISHAQAVKNFGHPMFLRVAHEMNGNWFPWDGAHNGNNPSLYIAAWRHLHDVFVQQGATNAVWVWCPNSSDVPGGATWNHWTNYYPGDAYADWVGIDGYNWGSTGSNGWKTFSSVFGGGTSGVYANYASKKPIMIVETASAETGAPAGSSKAQWTSAMASAIQSQFPAIEALLWFDTPGSSSQWPISSSTAAQNSYIAAGRLSYFKPAINWSLTAPTPTPKQTPTPTPTRTPTSTPKPSPTPTPARTPTPTPTPRPVSATGPIVGIAGKCLDNSGSIAANGNKIQLWNCNGSAAQNWSVQSTTGPITSSNGYCLDVKAAGTTPGTLVQLYKCNGTVAQQWSVNTAAGAISNPHSGLCLDDQHSGTANGTQIQIWTCNGGTAQKWNTAL